MRGFRRTKSFSLAGQLFESHKGVKKRNHKNQKQFFGFWVVYQLEFWVPNGSMIFFFFFC